LEQILKELHLIIASQERMHAEVTSVKAEVQQVRTEVTSEAQLVHAEVTAEMQQVCGEVTAAMLQVHAEVQVWSAEMEKTVRTVELNEAQLCHRSWALHLRSCTLSRNCRRRLLFVLHHFKLCTQMCAKLEMMQNKQEKKKGN